MSTYTIDGYLAALIVRENRTLLVEGRDDKYILTRCTLELEEAGRNQKSPSVVDSAELLRGEGIALGNRALVEHIHSLCRDADLPLAAVVDREYRGFQLCVPIVDELPQHTVVNHTLFWTSGHSIEHYLFEPEYFIGFIKSLCPDELNIGCLAACAVAYRKVLTWGAAIGLGLYETHLLSRAAGIVKVVHWTGTESGEIEFLVEDYAAALSTRGVQRPSQIQLAEIICDRHTDLSTKYHLSRRIAHGHITWESLWCGLAAVLRDHGAPIATVEAVAYGHGARKRAFVTSLLAGRLATGNLDVLPHLWDWLFE